MSGLIDILAGTPKELATLVQRAGEERLDLQHNGEWSIRTTIAHLRDEESLVFRLRLERMLSESEPVFASFPPDVWAASRKQDRDETRTLLQDMALQRKASVNVLERLRPDEWERIGTQPGHHQHTVASWVEYWTTHDREHLRAIERTLAALG